MYNQQVKKALTENGSTLKKKIQQDCNVEPHTYRNWAAKMLRDKSCMTPLYTYGVMKVIFKYMNLMNPKAYTELTDLFTSKKETNESK